MSGYIYCKIYYGIWIPDFALDGQKAIYVIQFLGSDVDWDSIAN